MRDKVVKMEVKDAEEINKNKSSEKTGKQA